VKKRKVSQAQKRQRRCRDERYSGRRALAGNGLADLFEFSPLAYFGVGPDSRIRLLNAAACRLLGLPDPPVAGSLFAAAVAAESQAVFKDFLASMFAGAGRGSCELRLSPAGRCSSVPVFVEAVADIQRRLCNLVITDLGVSKTRQDSLREQKEFFRLVAENVDGFIAVLDSHGRRVYNSPSYARLVGERDISGSNSFADVHPADRARVEQAFCQTIASGVGQRLEYRFMKADGGTLMMESNGGVVHDRDGRVKYVVVVSRDITERKAAEARVHHLAFYDSLTQLPNRLTLEDRLHHAMASSKRSGRYGALLFIDLDHFKEVNDAHGHGAGDLLLIQAVERIVRSVRETDTVARFGGDEFVVMLGELDVDLAPSMAQAEQVAEKIRSAIAEPYVLSVVTAEEAGMSVECHCTASIGVTLFLNHEHSLDELLQLADIAMYRAKGGGRDRVCYTDLSEKNH
jgi:diguanylate cyclase (GGDEF)-like protein/PAS domain S-box-containing protein